MYKKDGFSESIRNKQQGDTLSIILLLNKEIISAAEDIFNPRNNMMISHNDGTFNHRFNHERDTLVLTNALRNINIDKYTPEELDLIRICQNSK